MVLRATNTKNFETDFRVSSQSTKLELNVFSIIHLNGHNFSGAAPISRKYSFQDSTDNE